MDLSLSRAHFEAMGTVVSLAAPGRLDSNAVSAVQAVFEQYEQVFSLYRPDSEASRLARGEVAFDDLSRLHEATLALALDWRDRTAGAFTPHRPDGVVDLAGVVKALAIAGAGEALAGEGLQDWCVNAGGDVLCSGRPGEAKPWVVGIVDPDDSSSLLTQHTCTTALPAVATSGTAERGEHVWRVSPTASSCGAEDEVVFTQVTVAGPDIVTADVLATAILSGGRPTLEQVLRAWPVVQVIAAHRDGLLATNAFRATSNIP